MPAIPALIVSGFLGSGKTTLVRHLLAQAQAEGAKLAIVSNEFGDTGIDRALLDSGNDGLVELDGGCVCCKLSDALGETLEMLLTQVKPDRLVIETSGVALPGELLVQFWRPPLDALISEEVVVVVVDCEYFLRERPEDSTFLAQIEAADVVLLNKCDLLEAESIEGAQALIDDLTGGQPLIHTSYSAVDPTLLFPPDPEGSRVGRRTPTAVTHEHSHEQFVTRELAFDGLTTETEVRYRVALQQPLRTKGFFRTADGVRLIQGVGPRIEIGPPPTDDIPEDVIGRVVMITRE